MDVTAPEILVYPQQSGAGKPAIIVLPGGGYTILAADLEGSEVAQWLHGLGFASAVLHYRCPDNRATAYQDGRRAISWLRAHAEEFGADPQCVGVIGFSAGAHLAIRLAARNEERPYARVDAVDDFPCRPDFAMPIYPAFLLDHETGNAEPNVRPNPDMPPLFIAQSRDDCHFCAERYAAEAVAAGADVKSCIYETGGHGYGIRPGTDIPAPPWTPDAEKWLKRFTDG